MRDTDFSIIVNCSSMHRRNRERERRKKIVSPIFLSFLFFISRKRERGEEQSVIITVVFIYFLIGITSQRNLYRWNSIWAMIRDIQIRSNHHCDRSLDAYRLKYSNHLNYWKNLRKTNYWITFENPLFVASGKIKISDFDLTE